METSLGVTFDDFVILAADRSECMSIIRFNEHGDKIHRLTSHIAMALTGEPGDTDQFSRFVQCNFELEKFRDDGWQVTLSRAYNWITWELATSIRSSSPYSVFPLVGGYDHNEKQPKLYWIDYLGTGAEVTYGAHGYGDCFAIGFLDRHHRRNMTREQAIQLVKGALDVIQKRLIIGQNIFQMVIVDKDGVHDLPDHVIDRTKSATN